MAKITKDTILADILEKPKAKEILEKYKLPCLGCPAARFEMGSLKIGEVAKKYNIDIKDILKELNNIKQ